MLNEYIVVMAMSFLLKKSFQFPQVTCWMLNEYIIVMTMNLWLKRSLEILQNLVYLKYHPQTEGRCPMGFPGICIPRKKKLLFVGTLSVMVFIY